MIQKYLPSDLYWFSDRKKNTQEKTSVQILTPLWKLNKVALQYFNFQCQIYESWANNYLKEKSTDRNETDTYSATLESHIRLERAWCYLSACTWGMLPSPSDLVAVTRHQAFVTAQLSMWAVNYSFASLLPPLNLWEMRRERTPRLLVIKSNILLQEKAWKILYPIKNNQKCHPA